MLVKSDGKYVEGAEERNFFCFLEFKGQEGGGGVGWGNQQEEVFGVRAVLLMTTAIAWGGATYNLLSFRRNSGCLTGWAGHVVGARAQRWSSIYS